MPFKVEGEARFAFTNAPGELPQAPDNGELKVQQADALLITRKADGTSRSSLLEPLLTSAVAGERPAALRFRQEFVNFADNIRLIGDGATLVVDLPEYPLRPGIADVPGLLDVVTDFQARFPRPQAFGVVFDAVLNSDGVTLRSGYTDNTLAMNVYHLACKNAGVEPRYPRLAPNRGVFCSGQIYYYGEGDYKGVRVFAPVSASASAQQPLNEDRISADRRTVTFFNQPPGKTYRLFINGANANVSTQSDVSGTVSFSYPAGIPGGATVSYTSETFRTFVVEPATGDFGDIDVAEVKKWGGAIKGGSRVLGLQNRQGQCITLDTGDQIMLGRGGIRGTPTVTPGANTVFTQANHGLSDRRILTMAVDTGNSLPGGFTSKTYYYVINSTPSTYQLSLTPDGPPVQATTAGNGVLTSSPTISRAGDVFNVDTPKGDVSPGLMLDWATTVEGRTYNVTISAGSPAVFTRNAHGLVNGDLFLLTTTGTLPAAVAGQTGLRRDTYMFVINATANTFQASFSYGGPAINSSDTGTGTHTVSAPILTWNGGVFQWQTIRERMEIEPHPVTLVGPVGAVRENIAYVTRCNTTIRGWDCRGIPEGLTQTALVFSRCTGSGAVECTIADLGVDETNYGIQFGLAANWFVEECVFRNMRRDLDNQRSKTGRVRGGNFSDGLGGHFIQGLDMQGGALSTSNNKNPQLLQFTGGDISFDGIVGNMHSPCISFFNMRPDYMSLGGNVVFRGCTIIIDLNSYPENAEISILDMFGPATPNDSLVDTEFPQSIVIDSSCNIIVRGQKLNRTIQYIRIGKNFGPIMQRRQKAPLNVRLEATWDIEDTTFREAHFIRALYTNTDQMYGPGPNITIRNVPELFMEVVASSVEATSKVEGRADVLIDCPRGRVRMTANQGGFKNVTIRGNPGLIDLSMQRTFPQGDEGSSIIDVTTGKAIENVFSVGGADASNKFIVPRDTTTLRINAQSATQFNNSTIVFPVNPVSGVSFAVQTSNIMNGNIYDGNGVAVAGSPPANLTAGQRLVFNTSRNRAGALEWVYQKLA